jgi:DNA-binding transcriptional LysR family regulator
MHDMHIVGGDGSGGAMDLKGLDLNLLRVLDAVLETRHVTRAARQLGLSQSAVSHAMARLRDTLGDELLVRGPGGLVPTARAEAIEAPLRAALARLSETLSAPAPFEPEASTRTFRIAAADYAQFVLLPPLLARLQAAAPRVCVWVTPVPLGDALPAALASGDLDLAIGVTSTMGAAPGLFERTLFEERFVCLVRADHPTVGDTLTLAQYVALPHAFIAPRGRAGGAVDTALAERGLSRNIAVAVPHFLTMPHVIAASDLIVTLAARVAHAFAAMMPLRIVTPPLPLPPFRIGATWHERHQRDPGHVWLRERLASVGGALERA